MNKYTAEQLAKAFCGLLRQNVEIAYCVGGASEDELLAAEADFLKRMSDGIAENLTPQTVTPTRRYE